MLVASFSSETLSSAVGKMTITRQSSSVMSAAKVRWLGMRWSRNLCSGENKMASVMPQKMASAYGHKIVPKASVTATRSSKNTLLFNALKIMLSGVRVKA